MKSLHIRNVDPNILAALKRLAKSHRRSLQGELHIPLPDFRPKELMGRKRVDVVKQVLQLGWLGASPSWLSQASRQSRSMRTDWGQLQMP